MTITWVVVASASGVTVVYGTFRTYEEALKCVAKQKTKMPRTTWTIVPFRDKTDLLGEE